MPDTLLNVVLDYAVFVASLVTVELVKAASLHKTKKYGPVVLARIASHIQPLLPNYINDGKDFNQLKAEIEAFLEEHSGEDWGGINPTEIDPKTLLKDYESVTLKELLDSNSLRQSISTTK